MSNGGTTEPPPGSLAHDLREFLRAYRAGAVLLDDIARGYVAGADVSRALEDLSDREWSASLVQMLTQSPDSTANLIEGLPLPQADKEELRRISGKYGPLIGEMLVHFGRTRLGPLEDPVTAVRISPRYSPTQQSLLLRVQLFSGSTLCFTTVDSAASLLWLAGTLTDDATRWLEWSLDKNLEVRQEERALLRERSEELAREAQRLADIAERFEKLDKEAEEKPSSAEE